MNSRRKKSLGKKIRPVYYVFCEGNTEKTYINFLKREYKIPIEIKSTVSKNRISQKYISEYLKGKPKSKKDRVFLLYDLDVPKMLIKLQSIKNVNLLVSNPAIELWFLLHHKNQTANISSENCTKSLKKFWKDYKKGELKNSQFTGLIKNQIKAENRAVKLIKFENPSSNIYEFIKILEEASKN